MRAAGTSRAPRNRASHAPVGLGLLAVALLALGASGCGRKVDFSHLRGGAGSEGPDSSAALARDVQDRWDSGVGDDAAKLSARLLALSLSTVDPPQWPSRARFMLDSLAVGADVAGAQSALVVNFFSRANPDGGAWPYLFWPGEKGVRQQALDGRNLHLSAVAARGLAEGENRVASIATLFGKRTGSGQQPLLMVWSHPRRDDPWRQVQTLGADSLGAVGTGEFETRDTSLVLVTETYRATRGIDECATCPHAFRRRVFAWGPGGFDKVEDSEVGSPYATFVHFIQALTSGDPQQAERWTAERELVDRARRLGWDSPGKGTWRVAPETDEHAREMVFFRGAEEAYRIEFTQRDGGWVIQNFDATSRSVE